MTDQAADIALFAVRVLVVLIPLLTSAVRFVLHASDFWIGLRAGKIMSFPLFTVIPEYFHLVLRYSKTHFHRADYRQVGVFASRPG